MWAFRKPGGVPGTAVCFYRSRSGETCQTGPAAGRGSAAAPRVRRAKGERAGWVALRHSLRGQLRSQTSIRAGVLNELGGKDR